MKLSVQEVSRQPSHRYAIGRKVSLARGFGYMKSSPAGYEIVALLPPNRTHFQYRIRSAGEAFERVAAENELTPYAAPAPTGAKA
jgi:hypothetical protein